MSTLQETVFLGAVLGSPRVVRPDKLGPIPKGMRQKHVMPKGHHTKHAKARRANASEHNH